MAKFAKIFDMGKGFYRNSNGPGIITPHFKNWYSCAF